MNRGMFVIGAAVFGAPALGQANCAGTSTGRVPLTDLGAGLYLGQYQGGLYPGGVNQPPPAHREAGEARAQALRPLNAAGLPSADGRIVLVSIGMSNTTQEFCSQNSYPPCAAWTFTGRALASAEVNHAAVRIINGARGGQSISTWDDPSDLNYDLVRDEKLAPAGLTEAQVQVLWIKNANPGPTVSLPNANADAFQQVVGLAKVVRSAKTRYPNLKLAFLSSRIYAGYASTNLNREPYAYEAGFAVKWLIEAQITQMGGGGVHPLAGNLDMSTVAPWIGWGAYLWADGTTPRSDGLTWVCADFENDGTHPAQSGESKVGQLLLNFMLQSPFSTPWFRRYCAADVNRDGEIDFSDVEAYVGLYVAGDVLADWNRDGEVDFSDLELFVAAYTTGHC